MKTIHVSQDEMATRISRFDALKPLPSAEGLDLPLAAKDVIYSRKLMSVIGLGEAGNTPINQGAPIQGAAGMTMTFAECPPGTGPSLHAHLSTYETFTVLRSRFEFRWNDDGAESAVLAPLDTISIPPGVCRAFRNVGDETGLVQVLVTGGVHDMNDIDFPEATASELAAFGPGAVDAFKEMGFTFTAGRDE